MQLGRLSGHSTHQAHEVSDGQSPVASGSLYFATTSRKDEATIHSARRSFTLCLRSFDVTGASCIASHVRRSPYALVIFLFLDLIPLSYTFPFGSTPQICPLFSRYTSLAVYQAQLDPTFISVRPAPPTAQSPRRGTHKMNYLGG